MLVETIAIRLVRRESNSQSAGCWRKFGCEYFPIAAKFCRAVRLPECACIDRRVAERRLETGVARRCVVQMGQLRVIGNATPGGSGGSLWTTGPWGPAGPVCPA